jgi:formamidopyrimidine-DNA glycosylase
MPELPEVETVVRALRQPLIGQTIIGLRNDWLGHIVTPKLPELRRRISGRRVETIRRRGKYLVFDLSNGETLIIHLKMSGHLAVASANAPADKYVHTAFELASGDELRFRDVRKFGRVYLVHDPAEILGKLGPEPLSDEFTPAWLHDQLQGRRRVLKPLLLDQSFVAGIGNIYADEALFYARLQPTRTSNTLTSQESQALHAGIRKALEMGIAREGASIDNYRKPDGTMGSMQLAVAAYGRSGEVCYRCGGRIERIVLGGRGTHFCPECQI